MNQIADQEHTVNNNKFFSNHWGKNLKNKTSSFLERSNTSKPVKSVIQKEQPATSYYILSSISITCLVIILLVRTNALNILKDYIAIITTSSSSWKRNIQINYRSLVYVYLTFFLLLSLSVFLLSSYNVTRNVSTPLLLAIPITVVFHFIRKLVLDLSIWFYDIKIEISNLANAFLHYWPAVGLLLAPINVILLLADFETIGLNNLQTKSTLIIISITLALIIYAIKIIDSIISVSRTKSASIFHIILYICTLEILPILLIGKIFIRTF